MPEDYTINSKVAIAKQYIIQHSTEPISLQEVADYVDLNATYFRHLFKKVMHISFQEYVTNIRISNVCMLLVNSDRNISEIIHSVGFSNSSQFYHTFFEYYQMTPAEYRRTSGTRRTKLETQGLGTICLFRFLYIPEEHGRAASLLELLSRGNAAGQGRDMSICLAEELVASGTASTGRMRSMFFYNPLCRLLGIGSLNWPE